jgi:hypothetical protein
VRSRLFCYAQAVTIDPKQPRVWTAMAPLAPKKGIRVKDHTYDAAGCLQEASNPQDW